MEENIQIDIDPGRLLFGLSRIGYTTSSAICDIVDNSIRAKASHIEVLIVKERPELSDTRKNNVKEYLIIDDGDGMDEEGIKNALILGSSNHNYELNPLSKFGLGLKSATFSQADILEIISSNGNSSFLKYRVSLPEVISKKSYFANKLELSNEDELIIQKFLSNGKGTIIRLGNVRKVNHPSVKKTLGELSQKAGVIYYYFLNDGVSLKIDGKDIYPVDPLFCEEADNNSNLDENNWSGKSVNWIEKQTTLTLDDEESISCSIEITQLPYPPIYKIDPEGGITDLEIRKKYLIATGNYGFYVYRNKRLIAWASNLNDIIPQDQDYFAFRGRILIDDSADDFFNIDVKKSTLTLSEEAHRSISDFAQEAKYKSKKAWKRAGRLVKELVNKEPNEISNKIVNDFDQLDILPGDEIPSEEFLTERMESLTKDMDSNASMIALLARQDEGFQGESLEDFPSKEEKQGAIKGKENPKASKIFRVSSVMDNLLWEPYYDTDLKNCVRINRYHRFGRYIFEKNIDNKDLQIIFELLLLQFSESEIYAYKNLKKYKYEDIKDILTEFRRIVSEFLANMNRQLEDSLPPYDSSDDL